MKTKVLLVAIMTILSLSSFKGKKSENSNSETTATTSISGVITDVVSGETLAGVEVQLDGANEKVYTDFDGKFEFKNVAVNECKLSAKLISYKEVNCNTIKLDSNKNCSIKLQMKQIN